MMKVAAALFFFASSISRCLAQDPAPGWLGYATASCPTGTAITFFGGDWAVGASPPVSSAFFSPWIGIDASDNLNLLQPVNPWLGDHWEAYNEYYQWSPEYNFDSDSTSVTSGDKLHGEIQLNSDGQGYTVRNFDITSGWSVNSSVPIQANSDGSLKTFTIAYVVFEKVADCSEYPPDGKVVFDNLRLVCSGKLASPEWTTGFVEDVCNNRARIVSPSTIVISWDTSAENPTAEVKARIANRTRRLHRA